MDVETQIVAAVGAIAGGYVTYKSVSRADPIEQAATVAAGCLLGAAVASVAYEIVQDYNPLIPH